MLFPPYSIESIHGRATFHYIMFLSAIQTRVFCPRPNCIYQNRHASVLMLSYLKFSSNAPFNAISFGFELPLIRDVHTDTLLFTLLVYTME